MNLNKATVCLAFLVTSSICGVAGQNPLSPPAGAGDIVPKVPHERSVPIGRPGLWEIRQRVSSGADVSKGGRVLGRAPPGGRVSQFMCASEGNPIIRTHVSLCGAVSVDGATLPKDVAADTKTHVVVTAWWDGPEFVLRESCEREVLSVGDGRPNRRVGVTVNENSYEGDFDRLLIRRHVGRALILDRREAPTEVTISDGTLWGGSVRRREIDAVLVRIAECPSGFGPGSSCEVQSIDGVITTSCPRDWLPGRVEVIEP